jgi:hypothetical protein
MLIFAIQCTEDQQGSVLRIFSKYRRMSIFGITEEQFTQTVAEVIS